MPNPEGYNQYTGGGGGGKASQATKVGQTKAGPAHSGHPAPQKMSREVRLARTTAQGRNLDAKGISRVNTARASHGLPPLGGGPLVGGPYGD
jgi:hypothetical protein